MIDIRVDSTNRDIVSLHSVTLIKTDLDFSVNLFIDFVFNTKDNNGTARV